jgi:4-azaleucine resistance transporter AzlC
MFKKAFPFTVPVLLGYLAIGVAFGLLLKNAGYPWYLAPAMSIVVYAGALQYFAVGLFASNASIVEIAVASLLLNARHMVYGLSLLEKYREAGRFRPYLIFALTDETYALVTSTKPPEGTDPGKFYAAVSFLDQCYWVAGSTIGAIAGGLLPFEMKGLEFALTALFIVLFVEQLKTCPSKFPFIAAFACTSLAYLILGPENLLLISLGASLAVLVIFRKKSHGHAAA